LKYRAVPIRARIERHEQEQAEISGQSRPTPASRSKIRRARRHQQR